MSRLLRIGVCAALLSATGCAATYECDAYQFGELLYSDLEFEAGSAEEAEDVCEAEMGNSVDCRNCE